MVAVVLEDEEIFFDEPSDPGWANNTPWYMTELISKDTTKELSPDSPENKMENTIYRTRAIITRGLYTFYPLFEVQKRFFKGLFS